MAKNQLADLNFGGTARAMALQSVSMATPITRSGTTGAQTVDWTLGNNQVQPEPTGTITFSFTAPDAPCHLQLMINSDGTSTAQTINWPGTVIWYGKQYAGVNNKRSMITFFWDGTNYHATTMDQI